MAADCTYRFGDLTVATSLPLTSLPHSRSPRAAWRVRFDDDGAINRHDVPYHTWRDQTGRTIATFARAGSRRVISFRNVARFDLDAERGVIACTASRRTPPAAIAQLLVHQVLPLAAGIERLALHASAVIVEGQAVAFAGRSGMGKSTMAARLAHRGHELVTDDVAIVEHRRAGPSVVPMGAPIRLWPDAVRALMGPGASRPLATVGPHSRKRILRADPRIHYAHAAVPLGALFILEDAGRHGPAIVRLDPRDAVAEVMRHAFVLHTDDPVHAARLFERASQLARHASAYRLLTPSRFAELDGVIDAVLSELRTKN